MGGAVQESGYLTRFWSDVGFREPRPFAQVGPKR
jgi:hypothetical protein